MKKLTTLTIVAGLVSALTTLAPSAAILKHPNNTPKPAVNESNCADEMGYMRRVSRADIDAIHGQNVFLIAICEDLTLAGKDNYGPLFINGNVDTLRGPIGRNATLMSALRDQQYDQHDVVSLRFGGNDSIILYVYQRTMR